MNSEQAALFSTHEKLARNLAAKYAHKQADFDDLLSHSLEALWHAAESWDSSRGVPFGAYCRQRICARLIDWVRSNGPRTRDGKDRPAMVHETVERAATQDETDRLMEEEFWAWVDSHLPQQSRTIVSMYYRESWGLKEIAAHVRKSSPWVSLELARCRQWLGNCLHPPRIPVRIPPTAAGRLLFDMIGLPVVDLGKKAKKATVKKRRAVASTGPTFGWE